MVTDKELLECAKKAAAHAYAPYSRFRVGAALLTKEGDVICGCNVENASFGATNCAERTAVFKAVSDGYRDFMKIAVAAGDGSPAYPCGICLQVLHEFMPDGTVILEIDHTPTAYAIGELLPHGFQL